MTHHLNGGTNGLAQRREWFARWWPVLKDSPADAPPAPVALIDSGEAQAKTTPNDGVLRYGRGHDSPDFEVKAL